MTWKDLKRKLTSRKFWVAVTSFATLLLTSLGMDEQGAAQIAAIIMAVTAFILWLIRWKRQGAKKSSVILSCILIAFGVAQGIVQEFAVDSNPNLLLEYGIMAACLALIAAVSLIIRRKAE